MGQVVLDLWTDELTRLRGSLPQGEEHSDVTSRGTGKKVNQIMFAEFTIMIRNPSC